MLIFDESNIYVESITHIMNFQIEIRIYNLQLNSNFEDYCIWGFCKILEPGLILAFEI